MCVHVVVKTLNVENSRYLAAHVKKVFLGACRTCSTIIFHHSTNQIIVFWRHRCPFPCTCRPPCLTTTKPQTNDLISWMRKNNRAARVVCFLVQCFDAVCQTTTWICHIWGSQDNTTHNIKFLILCLHMKTIPAKQAKELFANFVQRAQHGIVAKTLNLTQSAIVMWCFRCSSRRSFLKLPKGT